MRQTGNPATPAMQAIRVEDWAAFVEQHHKRLSSATRPYMALFGVLCGVGAALLITAYALLIQEVAAQMRMRKQHESGDT